MYEAVTVYINGRRRHIVIDETGKKIGEEFSSFKQAQKASKALNREVKRQEKQRAAK